MSGYDDLANTHVPATGTVAPAAWGLQIRENDEFLIDPPACSVYGSAAESVASSTNVWLSADSENYDNDAMHSTVTNTSRITAQTAGRYQATAVVVFEANTTVPAYRSIRWRVNGGSTIESTRFPSAGVNTTMVATGVRTFTLAAGDYLEVGCIHNAGVALNVTLDEFVLTFRTR